MLRLAVALFAVEAGFHAFTASLPIALARAGVPDPQIGLIVGTAALVQIPAAFVVGVVVDRVGGLRALTAGGLAYLVGCAILLLPGVEPGGPSAPFLAARVFQGIGIAATLPAALSLVPRLVAADRRGFGLGFVESAHNLTLVVMPPLSLAVLAASSLHGVAAMAVAFVLVGLAIVHIVPLRFRPTGESSGDHDGPPMLVEISRRSLDADRGSAFSLFSAANATALAIGSIGGAIVLDRFGFEGAMLVTLAGIAGAALLALLDHGLRRQPSATAGRPVPAV